MSDHHKLWQSIAITTAFVAVLWWIQLASWLWGLQLRWLGVIPGTFHGLIGIVTAPLIHGSFEHLLANTLPLLILGSFLLYGYPRSRWWVLAVIWLGSGLGVWLTARSASHFGASGVAHGLMFFLFVVGLLRRDKRAIALAMLTFFLYGSMVWGIFPSKPGISWESHFWGAVMGTFCALLFFRADPYPASKRYSWDGETGDEEEDPIIGDLWAHSRQPEEPARFEESSSEVDEDEDGFPPSRE
ncbi:MAG TPA: rhomboid family intramembrane serine protease [Gammaproteobacteria bacterium]|nr:rhomboid family intramembrane serine protease [Gammaproteobacteria bacterium]